MKNTASPYKYRGAKSLLAVILSALLALSIWVWNVTPAHAEEPAAQETTGTPKTSTSEPAPSPSVSSELLTPATSSTASLESVDSDSDGVTTVNGYPCKEGEVLVQFRKSASDSSVQNTLNALDTESTEEVRDNLHLADVPEGETIPDYIETLEAQPDVLYAQPNYVYYLDDTECVPVAEGSLGESRELDGTTNDPGRGKQWYLDTIGVSSAWDTTMGSPNVRVAVLDTGADLNHPDLAGRILYQTDVVDNDGSAYDDNGHGTHVAGIIAANANNGIGVVGVAPDASLIIVDVFDKDDKGTAKTTDDEWGASTSDIVEGIYYAWNKGADVINLSLGSYSSDAAETNAINAAVSAGIVVVAAAGNDSSNAVHYPSDLDNVISVTATNKSDAFASYSNYGPLKDLAAPGGDGTYPEGATPYDWILSTFYDTETGQSAFAYMLGTSMSAPVVSGVVALMLSADPSLSVNDVKNYLYSSATDLGSVGRDDYFGNGRVNAALAIRAVLGIKTSSYTIDRRNNCLTGITRGTSVSTVLSNLSASTGTLQLYDTSGQELTSGTVLTGMYVRLTDGSTVKDELGIAIRGDINGDNTISIADYTLARLYILGKKSLLGAYKRSADVNNDGSINVADYTALKLHILGTQLIS